MNIIYEQESILSPIIMEEKRFYKIGERQKQCFVNEDRSRGI